MADRTNEERNLALVQELIGGPAGFDLERIEATPQERRPDFRMVSWRGLVGYCEVKSPRDDWLDEQLERAPPGTIVGGGRPDPTFNRVARHVLKAVKQFDAVNPDHSLPNVLVFVNHDDNSGYPDMFETLTGRFRADSGEAYETMTHISNGVPGEKRKRIDLYIWIDDYRGRRCIGGWLMTDAVRAHTATLRTLLINILPKRTAAA
jgi:hypothetical protein